MGHFLSTVVVVFFLYEIIMSYCERNQKKETNHAGIKWAWHHPIKYATPLILKSCACVFVFHHIIHMDCCATPPGGVADEGAD